MRGMKIPQQDFALKMPGGLMREGGVFAGHYGRYFLSLLNKVQGCSYSSISL